MGLELAASPPSSSRSSSVVVAGVVRASPAEKAGILTGDLLVAVDGEEVHTHAVRHRIDFLREACLFRKASGAEYIE